VRQVLVEFSANKDRGRARRLSVLCPYHENLTDEENVAEWTQGWNERPALVMVVDDCEDASASTTAGVHRPSASSVA
jgi:hypothetical protein